MRTGSAGSSGRARRRDPPRPRSSASRPAVPRDAGAIRSSSSGSPGQAVARNQARPSPARRCAAASPYRLFPLRVPPSARISGCAMAPSAPDRPRRRRVTVSRSRRRRASRLTPVRRCAEPVPVELPARGDERDAGEHPDDEAAPCPDERDRRAGEDRGHCHDGGRRDDRHEHVQRADPLGEPGAEAAGPRALAGSAAAGRRARAATRSRPRRRRPRRATDRPAPGSKARPPAPQDEDERHGAAGPIAGSLRACSARPRSATSSASAVSARPSRWSAAGNERHHRDRRDRGQERLGRAEEHERHGAQDADDRADHGERRRARGVQPGRADRHARQERERRADLGRGSRWEAGSLPHDHRHVAHLRPRRPAAGRGPGPRRRRRGCAGRRASLRAARRRRSGRRP